MENYTVYNNTPTVMAEDFECLYGTFVDLPIDIISVIIGICGMLGNLFFLFVIARARSLQNATTYLLVSLCISDLVYLLMHTIFRPRWLPKGDAHTWDQVMCIKGSITNSMFSVSIFTILTIAVERYLGVCKPMFYKVHSLDKFSRLLPLLITLWVLGFTLGFTYSMHCYVNTDYYDENLLWWVTAVVMTVIYFVSMTVVVVLYALVVQRIKQSNARLERSKNFDIQRQRVNVVRLCIVTAVVFFFCLFPRTLYILAYFNFLVTGDSDFVDTLYCWNDTFIAILMINSAVNPAIYNATCSIYRNAFAKELKCSSKKSFDPKSAKSDTLPRRNTANDDSDWCGTMVYDTYRFLGEHVWIPRNLNVKPCVDNNTKV
ncbi:neuromedin-U receptor 2-like [Saccoglossus kowalevskii]|uniref:Neuromedin-U receptor 2-like n=1 Tax=Saccoglossus kowalevskii TaxID=10224 RepID=A0ABM0MLB0_SACKO|nr:PREDICTED: neuromedin-U receptor 2-like [Saccoglossus kowalevskii]